MSTQLVRLDDEVMGLLLKKKQGWESPNKTLRRLLGLGPRKFNNSKPNKKKMK